ncbi:MAG TPA: ATP-dependent DNA ligase [Acidimicrobiia bacterium]
MEVTHPERVVFPDDGITKGEVVAYYTKVASRMLPFIEGRALSVERFPQGIGGKGFMQKNAPDHYPEDLIGRHELPKEGGGTTVYPVVNTSEGIEFFANFGAITFHVPSIRIVDEDHPDWVIWDLDPPPERVALVREAAVAMRSFLEGYGIPTVLLASGSKGYHLRARLRPGLDLEAVARIARGTAELAVASHEELLTVAFRKADREERVFVDWMRNTGRSTSVAPWSLRPRSGAPVAAPLAWEELTSVEPDGIQLRGVDARMDVDPWSALKPIDLTSVLEHVDRDLTDAGIELEPFDRFRS